MTAFNLQLDITADFFCHVASFFGVNVPLVNYLKRAELPKQLSERTIWGRKVSKNLRYNKPNLLFFLPPSPSSHLRFSPPSLVPSLIYCLHPSGYAHGSFVRESRQGCFVTPLLVRPLRSLGYFERSFLTHNLRQGCVPCPFLGYVVAPSPRSSSVTSQLFLDRRSDKYIAHHITPILPAPHIGPTTPVQPPSQPQPTVHHEIFCEENCLPFFSI